MTTIPALAIQFLAGNPPKLPPERCVTGSGALRLVGSQNHHEISWDTGCHSWHVTPRIFGGTCRRGSWVTARTDTPGSTAR